MRWKRLYSVILQEESILVEIDTEIVVVSTIWEELPDA